MLDPRTIYEKRTMSCVAFVVDINGSEKSIDAGEDRLTGQFFRDLLAGGIRSVGECNGSVISFTGDGFIAVLPTETDAAHACWGIARDLRKTREYLKDCRVDFPKAWPQVDVGVGLKVAIERGVLEVNNISSAFLGVEPFLIGPTTVYASRISAFDEGDRCIHRSQRSSQLAVRRVGGPI